jgi:antitoxin component YwqK of YwqJK toxin-antitoxin module
VKFLLPLLLLILTTAHVAGQGYTRQAWHDPERRKVKEVYQVKDTVSNTLHGHYISYFLNGKIESKGQFTNDETTGIWEFFYETGTLKMRGILFKGANYGLWEYFFESGKKSMEGVIYGKKREGEWKMYYENGQIREIGEYTNNERSGIWNSYFEDGVLKGSCEYENDFGKHIEYYHSGKVFGTGPKSGTVNTGHWRYFHEDGSLQAEGDFEKGLKQGRWYTYYPSGKVSSEGTYHNDQPTGEWTYYFEQGTVSSSGAFADGKKEGHWKSFSLNGSLLSEATYKDGSGEYREYYSSGAIKIKGRIENGKREGRWIFFTEDGKEEGRCDYTRNKGMYYGYFPNGSLHTRGALDGEVKTGTWEIYNAEGTLSGYYKPFYETNKVGEEISILADRSGGKANQRKQLRGSRFAVRYNEFKGVIGATNPLWLAAGRFPLNVEFYQEERLGHEFEFVGIRDPFFKQDINIGPGKKFERGYSVAIKQKFYNPLTAGMWYFGHEIRFTNLGHFVNQPLSQGPDNIFTFNAVEQRLQWGPLLGYRIMRRNNARGFTMDCFVSANFGFRTTDIDPNYSTFFENIDQRGFARTFNFGLNIGNVFSY